MQVRWWVAHPYRTAILSDPERCAPIRVWGDESAINKERDRNVLIGSFASLTSTLQTRLRELLSFCIQKEIIIWDATDFCAYEVWTWSFNQLALGVWPTVDHNNKIFTNASRLFHAGKPLVPTRDFAIVILHNSSVVVGSFKLASFSLIPRMG